MYLNHIKLAGRAYKTGDRFKYIKIPKSTDGYRGLDYIVIGEIVKLATIKRQERRDGRQSITFGIEMSSGIRCEQWHNLDGMLPSRAGYYIREKHLIDAFTRVSDTMFISKPFSFKRRDLKNMKCKTISPMPGGKEMVVEFDEDVGGCGADGLGKAGHCLVVPNNVLMPIKEKEKSNTNNSNSDKKA